MLLRALLAPSTQVVAIGPGKVMSRVLVSDGEGLIAEPTSIPISRAGVEKLERSVNGHATGRNRLLLAIHTTGAFTGLERWSWSGASWFGAVVPAIGKESHPHAIRVGQVQNA